MAIRTERLLLRAPALADAASISLLAGDYEVASMTGTIPHPYSEEMAVDWIQSLQAGEEGVAFAIDRAGALIGCVGYRATEKTHAEMGYWIGKPYWGWATPPRRRGRSSCMPFTRSVSTISRSVISRKTRLRRG